MLFVICFYSTCISYLTCAEKIEVTDLPTQSAKGNKNLLRLAYLTMNNVLFLTVKMGFDPSKIKVTEEGDKICVSYAGIKVCFNSKLQGIATTQQLSFIYSLLFSESETEEKICGIRLGTVLTLGCRMRDEENYLGLCYKKCSILTDNSYPLRTATNTCAKNGCGPNEEEDAGLCYPQCKQYYKGVGPVCWGYCSHFCGSDYTDMGLYCYRWWPPHACNKPSYGRGVGTLPYAPWTKGMGCNGFGINGDGGCALIDVLNYIELPYGITCP